MGRTINREQMTEKIHINAEPELRHMAERAAAKADRTLSDWVRLAIKRQAQQELGDAA